MSVGVAAIERARDGCAAAPGERRRRIADQTSRARARNDGLTFSSACQARRRDRIAPAAITSAKRRLARSPRADDRHKARVERDVGGGGPIRIVDPDVRGDDLRRHCRSRRLLADSTRDLPDRCRPCRKASNSSAPLIHEKRLSAGWPHGLLVMESLPWRQGLQPSYRARRSSTDFHPSVRASKLPLRQTAEKMIWANFSISWRTMASAA